MEIRFLGFSKPAVVVVFIVAFFNYGCISGSNTGLQNSQPQDQSSSSPTQGTSIYSSGSNTGLQNSQPQDQSSLSLTQGTSIYRYLSAISNAFPDKDSLTSLCIRQHSFKLELPKQRIKFAHDIRLPASEEWSETKEIERQRYRTEIIQPPSVNGIVMKPELKQVPYYVTEYVEIIKRVSGTCIGTEYILE